MKHKIITTAIAVLSFIQFTTAQTLVHGGIYTNTTWTLANSPYVMDGNIVVFPGVTLTIEPGVEVRVKENGLSGTQYYLETRGIINMMGLPTAKITFKADTALTTLGSWVGILVKNSQGGSINYDYVRISNAVNAIAYDSWIPSLIVLHDCEFSYNAYAINVGTELYAENCLFTGNQDAISGWSIFTLKNCVFNNNAAALPIYASSLTITNCSFSNNNIALFLSSGSVNGILIKNTFFENNTVAIDNPNNGLIDSCTFLSNTEAVKNTVYLEIKNTAFFFNQTALQLGFGSSVRNCEINDNGTGVAIGPLSFGQPMPIIENNHICSNTAYNIDNRTDLNMFIPTNCFCNSDSSQIEQKIFDGYDDISKGLVSYAIFDSSCSVVLAIVNKSPVTGLNDKQLTVSSSVFPNPFNESLFISNSETYTSYQISNLQGQLVKKDNLLPGDNTLDVSSIPPGIYILNLLGSDQRNKYFKIVKN